MKSLGGLTALILGFFIVVDDSFAGDAIDEQMSCRAVRTIFDASQPDLAQVRAVIEIVVQEFTELDRKNAARSRPKIYARMSEEGKRTTSAVVTTRCDNYPDDNIKESTAAVYAGIEAMGDAMGVNE